jgi:ubiquitin-protein ligase
MERSRRRQERWTKSNKNRHVSAVPGLWCLRLLLLLLLLLLFGSSVSSTSSSSSSSSLSHKPPKKQSMPQSSNSSISSTTRPDFASSGGSSNDDDSTRICPDNKSIPSKKKKKIKPKPTKRTTALSLSKKKKRRHLTTAQTASLRRLQHEWKEAIHAGVAFDWVRGEPVQMPRQRNKQSKHGSESCRDNNNNSNTTTATISTTPIIKPSHVWIGPLNNRNLLVWHFTVTGLPGSVYEHGVYHGRMVLPPNYPDQPPRVQMWTPSGRFIPRHNICLSASHYHPETWNPSAWSCRTIVESLRLHMITHSNEIGGCNDSYEQRLAYAQASRQFQCHIQTPSSSSSSSSIVVDHARMIERGYIEMTTASSNQEDEELEEREDTVQQDVKETVAAEPTTRTKDSSSSACLIKDSSLHEQNLSPPATEGAPIKLHSKHKKLKKQKKQREHAPANASVSATRTTRTHNKHMAKTKRQQQKQHQQQIAVVPAWSSSLVQIFRKTPLRIGLLAFALLFCLLNR